jgi:class 3 adenylate cyclase
MSDGYISFIVNIDDSDERAAYTFAELLKKGEPETLNDIETVVREIQTLSDREFERVNRYYVVMIRLSFILMSAISFIMVAQVILTNLRVQKTVIAIGSRLNSYLPRQLVHSIINNGTSTQKALDKKQVTVCFTDLQGFTAMTERLDPDVTAKIMNEYLSEMSAIVRQYDGMIDKFIGDGIMILFGAFDVDHRDSHALNCVRMAVAMQKHMRFLKYKWGGEGIEHGLNLRIGINTGLATVGSFGPVDRQTFTVVGTTVNIASRLEGICPPERILIGEETYSLISGKILTKPHEVQSVKGIEKPVRSYEVIT